MKIYYCEAPALGRKGQISQAKALDDIIVGLFKNNKSIAEQVFANVVNSLAQYKK